MGRSIGVLTLFVLFFGLTSTANGADLKLWKYHKTWEALNQGSEDRFDYSPKLHLYDGKWEVIPADSFGSLSRDSVFLPKPFQTSGKDIRIWGFQPYVSGTFQVATFEFEARVGVMTGYSDRFISIGTEW